MRKSAKFCLYGVVLAGVVGGTAAWATTDKTVSVSIDGQVRTIHTRAGTVGGALHDADISIDAHDALAPGVDASIHGGSTIVLRRGRLLHLTVDGHAVNVWTTATTVDEALAALGYGSDKTVTVSRSARLPLTPTEIALVTPKQVTIDADGKSRTVVTTEQTVAEVLQAVKIKLTKSDKLSVAPTAEVTNGQLITVQRVVYKSASKTVRIPFTTESTKDSTQLTGTTEVVQAGKPGTKRVIYQLVYIDGKLAGRRILKTIVVAAPVQQVQKVGSKKAPVVKSSTGGGGGGSGPVPRGDAQAIAKQLVTARGWGGDQFQCLVDLWNRESGWRTNASNPSGAYGIPQALPGSKMASAGPNWQSNATTQITWGLGYISARYGTPCGAWGHSQDTGWY